MTELSGKHTSDGRASLPGRVETVMRIIMYMATLATDERRCIGWRHSGGGSSSEVRKG